MSLGNCFDAIILVISALVLVKFELIANWSWVYSQNTGRITGPSCSKLGEDNPGLVWNLISDLKPLKEYSLEFCLSRMMIGFSKKNRDNYPEKAFERGKKKTRIKI